MISPSAVDDVAAGIGRALFRQLLNPPSDNELPPLNSLPKVTKITLL